MSLETVALEETSVYSNGQLIVLEASAVFTGFVSMVSSLTIISFLWRFQKTRLGQMYERIMLGASLMDFVVSFGYTFLGPWMVPREVNFVLAASGNFTTCSIAGFVLNFMLGSLIYSAFLALFFLLIIVLEIQERKLSIFFEPFMHSIALLLPLTSGLYALSIQAMNPVRQIPGMCWMNEYPPDCLTREEIEQFNDTGSTSIKTPVECTRGMGFELLSFLCGTVLVGLSWIVITLSMICIIFKVYRTELRLRRYVFTDQQGTRSTFQDGKLVRTQQTCFKALLYIGSFVITYFGLVGAQILYMKNLDAEEQTGEFGFSFLARFFSPLQGFWHLLIYFRHQSLEAREEIGSAFFSLFSFRSSASVAVRSLQTRLSLTTNQIMLNLSAESTDPTPTSEFQSGDLVVAQKDADFSSNHYFALCSKKFQREEENKEDDDMVATADSYIDDVSEISV